MKTIQTQKQSKKSAVRTQAKSEPKQVTLHRPSNKPLSGNSLFAHTHGVLSFFGMFQGKQAPRAAFVFLSGTDTILRHHSDKFETVGKMVKLTEPGYFEIGEKATNAQRVGASLELSKAFQQYFRDGKPFKEWACGKAITKAFTL